MKKYWWYNFTVAMVLLTLQLSNCAGKGQSVTDAPSPEECNSGVITTFGEAPVFTSIDASRDKAKEDACRKAIEKCIGEEVAKISGVSGGQSIANEIFTDTKGICKNDQIVDEQNYMLDTVKMLKVFVRFRVQPVDIKSAIDTAQKMAGNPKLLVLIRETYKIPGEKERSFGFTSSDSSASAALREFLISKGYNVIAPERVRLSKQDEKELAANPTGDENLLNLIKDRSLQAGADVLIVGSLEVNPQNISHQAMGDFKSMIATGNVRLITLWGSGRDLGAYVKPQPGAHLTHLGAARKAAHAYAVGSERNWRQKPGKLAAFIQRKLKEEWGRITRENQIIINIEGMSPEWAGMFRDDLKERTAVKQIYEQGAEGGRVRWEVIYPGRSYSLADTIGYYGNNPRMFMVVQKSCQQIKVKSVKRGELNLTFTKLSGGCTPQ